MMRFPEHLRWSRSDNPTYPGDPFGFFVLPMNGTPESPTIGRLPHKGRILLAMACTGMDDDRIDPASPAAIGWDHVSISVRRKGDRHHHGLPSWAEMCLIKDLFWEPEDVVVQFHPRASEYVDQHPCLHLWHYIPGFPTPDPILVGDKRKEVANG